MERYRRFVMWSIAAVLAVPLLWKGHGVPRNGESVAFLHYSAPMVMVRLRGDDVVSGVYRFSDGMDIAAVIKMTTPSLAAPIADVTIPTTLLQNGFIMDLPLRGRHHSDIRISAMTAGEKMLLGIPLHPDFMNMADWDCLPGIGPGLAQRIVNDRQKNGDFGSLQAVERVPGMGKVRISKIKRYF